jgi:hypothetical protein
MEKGVSLMTFWSSIEGSQATATGPGITMAETYNKTNIGYLDDVNGNKKSTYHHFKMIADNFKGTFYPGTVTNTTTSMIKAFACRNEDYIAVMLLNQKLNNNAAHNGSTSFQINSAASSTTSAVINFPSTSLIPITNFAGTIDDEGTALLIFDLKGNFLKRTNYSLYGNVLAGNTAPTPVCNQSETSGLITNGSFDAPQFDNGWISFTKTDPEPSPLNSVPSASLLKSSTESYPGRCTSASLLTSASPSYVVQNINSPQAGGIVYMLKAKVKGNASFNLKTIVEVENKSPYSYIGTYNRKWEITRNKISSNGWTEGGKIFTAEWFYDPTNPNYTNVKPIIKNVGFEFTTDVANTTVNLDAVTLEPITSFIADNGLAYNVTIFKNKNLVSPENYEVPIGATPDQPPVFKQTPNDANLYITGYAGRAYCTELHPTFRYHRERNLFSSDLTYGTVSPTNKNQVYYFTQNLTEEPSSCSITKYNYADATALNLNGIMVMEPFVDFQVGGQNTPSCTNLTLNGTIVLGENSELSVGTSRCTTGTSNARLASSTSTASTGLTSRIIIGPEANIDWGHTAACLGIFGGVLEVAPGADLKIKTGFMMVTEGDIMMQPTSQISVSDNGRMRIRHSSRHIQSGASLNLNAGGILSLEDTATLTIDCGANFNFGNGAQILIDGGSKLFINGKLYVEGGANFTSTGGGKIYNGITGPTVICKGQQGVVFTTYDHGAGSTYNWTVTGDATIIGNGNDTVTVNFGANFSDIRVDVTNGGCFDEKILALTPKGDNLTITYPGSSTIYKGESITLTASGAASYLWSTGATTQSITVSTAGDYSVTDAAGCTSKSVHVTVNAMSGQPVVCRGQQNVIFSVPAASGATYNWWVNGEATITGNGTNSVSVNFGQNFTEIRVGINENGRYHELFMTLTPKGGTVAISYSPQYICPASAVTYTATTTGTINTYQWLVDGTAASTAKSFTQTLAPGSHTISLTGSDNSTCPVTATLPLTIQPNAGAISGLSSVCRGQQGVVYSITAITSATYNWWVNGDATITGNGTNSPTVNFGQNFTDIHVGVNVNGCYSESVLTLTPNGGTVSISGPNTACLNTAVTFTANTTGTINSYQWQVNGTTVSNSSSLSYTFTSSGTYTVTLTGTNSGSCSQQATTSVVVPGTSGPITGTASVCPLTNNVNYTVASGASSYNWFFSGGTGNNDATISSGAGTSSVNVNFNAGFTGGQLHAQVTKNGCMEDLVYAISKSTNCAPICAVQASYSYSGICLGSSVSFWSTSTGNPNTFEWKVNGSVVSTASSMNYTFNTAGTYTVALSAGIGGLCSTDSRSIVVSDIASISGATSVCTNQNTVYSVPSTPGATYNWWLNSDGYIVSGQGTNTVTMHIGQYFTNSNINVGVNANGCYRQGGVFVTGHSCARIAQDHLGTHLVDTSSIASGVTSPDVLQVDIAPNPVTEETYLVVTGTKDLITVVIMNVSGQVMYKKEQVSVNEKLPLGRDLATGVYIVQVISNQTVITKRVIK